MKKIITLFAPLFAFGAEAIGGKVQAQPLNVTAIVMFLIFVFFTLGITYWAAKKTRSPMKR